MGNVVRSVYVKVTVLR